MCRVIMVNRAEFTAYDQQYGILKLFDHLEKECGGHGNGYALIRDGKIIEARKGQKLSNEEIYERVAHSNWEFLVYHTRINSMGGRGDANCHPFVQDNDCLAMNGTEHSMQTLSDAFNRTDTECIFKNMIGLGLEQVTHALVELGSVFVGCAGGKPFVVKAGGTLHKWGDTFHASTFPADVIGVKDLPVGYIWEIGKENLQFVKTKPAYSWSSRWSSWEDRYYSRPLTPKPIARSSSIDEVFVGDVIYDEAYDRGYRDGKESGYEDGFDDACELYGIDQDADNDDGRFASGYHMGYTDAQNGVAFDLEEKFNPASEYSIGFADGREEGYEEGYEDGYSEARRDLGIATKEEE